MPWDQEFLKKFAPSEDQWKCPVCLVLNDKANEKCRSCENPNPNAKPRAQKRKASETEEPASKVAKTNNPGATFNFGTAASTTTSTSNVFNFGTTSTTTTSTSSVFNFGNNTTTTPTITPNLFNFGPITSTTDKKDDEKKEEKEVVEEEEDDDDEEEKLGDTKLYMMGSNELGQLGLVFKNEDEYEARKPTLLKKSIFKSNIFQISCGTVHCIALTSDGVLYSWGCNDKGALGRDGDEKIPLPVESKYFNNTKIVSLSSGNSHSVILNENGEIYSWGVYQDDHGDIGYDNKNKIMLRPHKITLPKRCNKVIYMKSGGDFTMFISDKGDIYGLGNNEQYQLGRKTSDRLKLTNLLPHLVSIPHQKDKNRKCKSIYCGTYHCICILENNNVYGWGQNTSGQLGIGDYENRSTPSLITFYNNERDGNNKKIAKEFGCGMHFTICLCEDGNVYSCGATSYGKLGIGELRQDEISKSTPTLIPSLSNIVNIAAGSEHSLAINNNGELYSWGFNETCQLGTGEENDEFLPKKIKIKNERAVKISCGTQHSAVITQI